MDAMTNYRNKKQEKRRFEALLAAFVATPSIEMKTIYMSFINALINTPTDIDLRLDIRNEFKKLGIDAIIQVRIPLLMKI